MFERALNSRGVKLRAIHEVLVGASSDELNYILQTINCAALVEVAWDETMVMLTRPGPRERLAELSVYTRSAAASMTAFAQVIFCPILLCVPPSENCRAVLAFLHVSPLDASSTLDTGAVMKKAVQDSLADGAKVSL